MILGVSFRLIYVTDTILVPECEYLLGDFEFIKNAIIVTDASLLSESRMACRMDLPQALKLNVSYS